VSEFKIGVRVRVVMGCPPSLELGDVYTVVGVSDRFVEIWPAPLVGSSWFPHRFELVERPKPP